ncbi:MAG: hypothetical protein ACI391_03795 [Muribaculaceae bacterium]
MSVGACSAVVAFDSLFTSIV